MESLIYITLDGNCPKPQRINGVDGCGFPPRTANEGNISAIFAWFIQTRHRFPFANSNGETDDVDELNTDIFCHQTYTSTQTGSARFKNVNVERSEDRRTPQREVGDKPERGRRNLKERQEARQREVGDTSGRGTKVNRKKEKKDVKQTNKCDSW